MLKSDSIKPWFAAAEATGEYIGIRFGHIAPSKQDPEWIFIPHSEMDGIGGFADLLRRRGADLDRLPQIKHAVQPSKWSMLRNLPKFVVPKQRLKWVPFEGSPRPSSHLEAPTAVGWHVFDEETTTQIRRACRKSCFTVNSFLLKHLSKAVRPDLEDQSASIPWMIPINLRGKVLRQSDVENHSSYVTVKVGSYDTVPEVHQKVYATLNRGDHWANWYGYDASRSLSHGLRCYLVRTEKYIPQWHLGGFSNLGDWDPDKTITAPGCQGDWLFAPPVLRCQHLGAGCVTFQNRLTLTLQAHPELTTTSDAPRAWMSRWVKEIQMDLVSLLPPAH